MALTKINRPIGRRFGADPKTAVVDNNFNYARFTSVDHGLSDGDFILIENSSVPAYNGIWYADVSNADVFFIRPSADVDFVSWVNDATLTIHGEDLDHMWSAVQLPIVYEVTTDLFPFNEATPLSIISIDNNNGFARLRLTGDFSATPIYPLEFIRVQNAADSRLNGIWQVQQVDYLASQAYVTIDLTYRGTYNQAGSQVTKYYSNYALVVQVYAGCTTTPGAVTKPVELAATLKFIPDSNNTVKFSISEILKSYVRMRNGVVDDTMPNQIDFFTEFYVTYQETYDYSFGYTLLRFEGSVTSDSPTYVGRGVNAKLAFGNPYSGYLSEYIMNKNTAKFLTLFAVPVLFACQDSEIPCYQDISFINVDGGGTLQREYYKDGVVTATTETSIPEKSIGVYRVPLQDPGINTCYYDSMRITLIDDSPVTFELALGNQVNPYNFLGAAWIDGTPSQDFISAINGSLFPTKVIYDELDILPGDYTFSYRLTKDTPGVPVTFFLVALDENLVIINEQEIITFEDAATHINTKEFTLPSAKYVGIYARTPIGLPEPTIEIGIKDFLLETEVYPRVSEPLMFRIDCGCSAQQIKLTWVNNLGGFDYWTFKAEKDYMTEVVETQTSEKNILPSWPQSYGHTADTLRYETTRKSRRQVTVRSQNGLTVDEAFALAYIKSSPLVQIMEGTKLTTVTVDTNTLRITGDGDKLREIEFTITETGDIPAQTS